MIKKIQRLPLTDRDGGSLMGRIAILPIKFKQKLCFCAESIKGSHSRSNEREWLKRILSIFALVLSLQGCVGAFLVGTALGGMVVYEGRNLDTQRRDLGLSSEISKKLSYDTEIVKHGHIVVSAYDGVVLLAGQCPTETMRERADATAQSVPGIKRLYNEITISGPISTITQSSDAVITGKVRSMLLAEKDLDSSQIKVVTENGIVYLMGKITHEQAQVTIDIARTVGGVQKVVTLFEYKTY